MLHCSNYIHSFRGQDPYRHSLTWLVGFLDEFGQKSLIWLVKFPFQFGPSQYNLQE